MLREMKEDQLREYLEQLLKVERDKLMGDIKSYALKYAELATKLARTKATYEKEKLALEILEAKLDKHYRATLQRVRERAVKEAIERTESWQKQKAKVIELKEEVDILEALLKAMEHKKDMMLTYISLMKMKENITKAKEGAKDQTID